MILKEYMARNGMSYKDLSHCTGFSVSWLRQIAGGLCKHPPSIKTAMFIEEITSGKVSIDELINPHNYNLNEFQRRKK